MPVPDEWVRALSAGGVERERAAARLHQILLRVARAEAGRRSGQLRISGPELDDLAHQAAADAVLAIIAKIGQFRGESRFTTWACKFVIFEVSGKIGRHFWRHPAVRLKAVDWDQLPDRFGLDGRESEWATWSALAGEEGVSERDGGGGQIGSGGRGQRRGGSRRAKRRREGRVGTGVKVGQGRGAGARRRSMRLRVRERRN